MKLKIGLKPKYIPLSPAAAQELKTKVHKEQGEVCPIVGKKFPLSDMVLDHKHKKKSDPMGKDGKGLVRGLIYKGANRIEGPLASGYARFGLSQHITLPEFLRRLADYLENPPLGQQYIHPTEVSKTKLPRLNKNDFNLVVKYWSKIKPKSKTPPTYREDMLMTGDWLEWVAKAKEIKNSR